MLAELNLLLPEVAAPVPSWARPVARVKAPAAAEEVAAAMAAAAEALSLYTDCEGIPYLLTFCLRNKITAYSIKAPG